MLRLEWFVAPSRWRNAVDNIIPLLTRRCPEALPTRYGEWEPPPHRFDRSDPAEFVEFVANGKKGNGFWYASRPSFGGSFSAPHADKYAREEDQRFRIGHIELTFDGRPIAADERWREAVVDLFIRGAELFRAFFGAAQLEPGWVVSRGNRPFVAARSLHDRDYLLRGRLWQGLPPVPLWLSWYGDPYRGLVTDAVHGRIKPPVAHDGRSLLKVFASRQIEGDPSDVEIKEGDVGIAVRLARDPLPRPQLPRLDLPDELTYKERRAIDHPGGGRESNRAKPEDRAAVIPELDVN